MIYDGLDVIERYRGLSRGLDVLIDWLGKNDPKDLPLGRTEIDGSRVFANVMEAKTKRREDARFEFHHRYADVQIDLEGEERFEDCEDKTIHCRIAELVHDSAGFIAENLV